MDCRAWLTELAGTEHPQTSAKAPREAALCKLPSPTLRKRPPPHSLPLLSLPCTGPPPGTVCEGQACGRPRGCGCAGDVGMKVSGGEGAGPVWQTLKGLSSRDVSCGSPTSPGPHQQQQQRGLQRSNTAAERLAHRNSCPLDASSSSPRPLKEVTLPHLILPEGDRSPVLYNGSVATPVSAPPITASGDCSGRTPWGPPSSSTTSTSLSNTNLALHKSTIVTPNNMLHTNITNVTSPKDEEPEADTPEVETPSVFR